MKRARLAIALALMSACSHAPTAPSNPLPPKVVEPSGMILSASPLELPAGGGSVTLAISVSQPGGSGLAGVHVTVRTTAGALEPIDATTDRAGYAYTTLTTTQTATVTAIAGTIEQTIRVVVGSTTSTSTTTTSVPGPPPPPPPPPPTTTTTTSSSTTTTTSSVPGGGPTIAVFLTATPPTLPVTGGFVTFTATLNPEVPLSSIVFDFGDGVTEPSSSTLDRSATHTYAANPSGTQAAIFTARATVVLTDGRSFNGVATVTVQPPVGFTVTLAASPSTVTLGTAVTLTATLTGNAPNSGSYAWDFDGNGTTDQTTAAGQTTFTYPTTGTKSAKVTVTAPDNRTAQASTSVTVNPQPFFVNLSVQPSAPQNAGTPLTFIATVSGNVPAGTLSYAWDYNNDGTIEETTASGTVLHTYNVKGTPTAKVTVTGPAADPRTATNIIQITVCPCP